MYGDNFLFLDRVVMEDAELHDGGMGFGCFTVPSPAENPIMKDHFVGMPLFGGHLQMEAVAQFGTFMILKCLEDKNLIPILTGTEFPNLNTMAPPGEKLSMMGIIHLEQKRGLTLEAFIENRYARSRGVVRGMILSQRILRKMTASFYERDSDDT
jgi:3-hydroxymyristoyl/3-hydroxydecanoyl-(acyl carrier protein) dehydratase